MVNINLLELYFLFYRYPTQTYLQSFQLMAEVLSNFLLVELDLI